MLRTRSRFRVVHGLALALASVCTAAQAQDMCQAESECSFKKPNILLVLDYSSSMTGFANMPAYFPPGQTATTRWGAELDAATWILRYQDGFFADNARIGLTRFAHDPKRGEPGTTLATDTSFPKITDGYAIDVPFDGSNGEYLECKGSGVQAAVEVLRGAPPPPIGLPPDPETTMLTWTRGALRSAHQLIERTRKNHAKDSGEKQRDYEVVLMTDGDWTCPDKIGQSCDEDPAPEAALLRHDGVPVSVIAFGDATMQPSLDEVALQGGTEHSIDATSPQGIVDAFSTVLDRIRNSVIVPECTGKLPRVLVIMDASSSMIAGNMPGQTKWDKARFALSGNPDAQKPGDTGYVEPLLRRTLEVGGRTVAIEDVVHLGMVAFAGADQQKLMVGFGPCMRDNFAWAMDPHTSCEAPGCTDPYAGYPTTWTFKNSDEDRKPPFVRTTQSYMPACNETQGSNSCVGQIANTFTGQGLAFAHGVITDYKKDPAPFHIEAGTRFVNVLITDGQTSQGSSSVQTELEAMVNEGIDTYVIGFGTDSDLDENQLQQYAMWGNTKSAIIVDPSNATGANALADALAGVVIGLGLDACCVLDDCAAEPEPADPKPVCGDGRVEGDEVCDDGKDNATYDHCGGRCDGPHLYCGDGRVDPPETCDDGNKTAGDGCDDCRLEGGEEDAGMDMSQTGAGGQSAMTGSGGSHGAVSPPPKRPRAARGKADAGKEPGDAAVITSGDGCGCRLASPSRTARSIAMPATLALPLVLRLRRSRRASKPTSGT
jgi:cysteine-rich repeat protein